MKIGLLMPFTQDTANPADFCHTAEELDFESMWVPEHPVLPSNPKTPFPQGGPIPPVYANMCDQFVALGMAAAATKKLKLATGICLVPEHNPLILAKQIGSLDNFSGGRFLFGIGAGWLREEAELLGADFPRRWTQSREYVAAMRELWTKGEASCDSKYVKFPAVRCFPQPAQWGDGWCPIRVTVDDLKKAIPELREECQKAGRDFSWLDITIMGQLGDERSKAQDELGKYAELGMGRYVIALVGGPLGPDKYKSELERLAKIYV
jgi:alkanesulfonate monooxygenase SsuD/methylene tetrahydromethanopterin reductase-like flavin-dependent oxidoreductase (luciferase family)